MDSYDWLDIALIYLFAVAVASVITGIGIGIFILFWGG
jgi:hypothetical protein